MDALVGTRICGSLRTGSSHRRMPVFHAEMDSVGWHSYSRHDPDSPDPRTGRIWNSTGFRLAVASADGFAASVEKTMAVAGGNDIGMGLGCEFLQPFMRSVGTYMFLYRNRAAVG